MARKDSRVNQQFLIDQITRRTGLESSDPASQKSVPELRDRVTVLERLLGVRSEDVASTI